MGDKKRLGDMLKEAGLITEEQLNKALKLQVGGNRRLGYLVVKLGFITEEQLQAILSQHLALPFMDINRDFNPEVRHILPRYLCKKYHVIPLDLGEHNILKIGMVDPSDSEAVSDIEQSTEKLLQPYLASHSAITKAIKKKIPWSLKDIFNSQHSQKITALTATAALILFAITIVQYNNDRKLTQYGTKKITADAVLYQNHDLMLQFYNSGQASLQGHGAHAPGTYSIKFNNVDSLQKFITRKQNDFSTTQRKWLNWTMKKQLIQ